MSLLWLAEWMASTQYSIALHESQYMYTIVESVHVLTLCLFMGFAVLFDLRLLNKALTRMPVSEVSRQLLPWTIGGFVIMVITGVALFYAIPVRTYLSIWFRFKMVFLLLAGLNVLIFHSGVYTRVAEWDLAVTPKAARRAGVASLVLWALIIVFGRFIAYNWFDCDIQPQSSFVNFVAGCVVPPTKP